MPKKPDTPKQTQQAHAPTPTRAGNSQGSVVDPALPDARDLPPEVVERIRRHTYLLSLPLPTPTRCPKARDDEAIVAQEVMDESVVYDLNRHKVHSLSPTAALVFGWCDGQTRPAAMVQRLAAKHAITNAQAEPLVWLAVDRLEKAKLLVARTTRPARFHRMTRRQTNPIAHLS